VGRWPGSGDDRVRAGLSLALAGCRRPAPPHAGQAVTLTSTAKNPVAGSLDGGQGYVDIKVPAGLTVTSTAGRAAAG